MTTFKDKNSGDAFTLRDDALPLGKRPPLFPLKNGKPFLSIIPWSQSHISAS